MHVAQEGVLEEAAGLSPLRRVRPERGSMLSALGLASLGAGARAWEEQMACLTPPSPGQPPHQP